MKLTQVTHYSIDDPKHEYDYLSIELLDEKGTVILSFSDAYHQPGKVIIEGFVRGVEYITGQKLELTEIDIADGPEQDWDIE